MSDVPVNKVAESGLITIDLERFLPDAPFATIDLKDFLFMELILKEKEFRESLKSKNWSDFQGRNVCIVLTADAIIPVWAYMLLCTYLQPFARDIFNGTEEEMYKFIVLQNILRLDASQYKDKRVVVKGCGDVNIDPYAYAAITKELLPQARSIMYGEPCSTVPVYKKKI